VNEGKGKNNKKLTSAQKSRELRKRQLTDKVLGKLYGGVGGEGARVRGEGG
jgi:hypothetical protein